MTPADAEDAIERSEEQALVTRALEAIDLERRAVLVLFELDEQPMKEIAASLELRRVDEREVLRGEREVLATLHLSASVPPALFGESMVARLRREGGRFVVVEIVEDFQVP